MADERLELDRLRKVKRLRELESREAINANTNSGNLDLPSNNQSTIKPSQQVAHEKGFFDGVGEFFTGSDRETRATQELPEIGSGGLLFGEDSAATAAITPALLTATNPEELGRILSNNFQSIGITSDEKGNLIANNNKTGAQVVLNKPGVSQFDILQGLGIAAAFTPAGRAPGLMKLAGATGGTSAGIEALQALSGGEFDASQVAIDTVTAGLLDGAFKVAKATGRTIRDVLRNDVKIDPDKILKDFAPKGTVSRQFGKEFGPTTTDAAKLQKVTQADLTPEALAKIRQAESQGVQLTKAQATGDFSASEAEQTLIKSISPEGGQARQFADQQQEQLQAAAKSFTERFGGSGRLSEAVGEATETSARTKGEEIQQALKGVETLKREEVTSLYTKAGETAGEAIPLNNSSIVEVADDIIVNRPITPEVEKSINTALAKFGLIGDSVEKSSRNKFKVMDGDQAIMITGEQTPLTLSNAEEFRKALNKAVGADQTGSAKAVVKALDDQVTEVIERGSSMVGGANQPRTEAFKTARQAAAKQRETFKAKDVIQDLVGFKKGTRTPIVDPETVITKIAKGDKAVTNIRKVKRVLLVNSTPETKRAWKSIQAETVGDVLSQAINKDTGNISGARLNSAIKKYKPDALRELLGNKHYAELKRLQETIGTATIPPPGTTNPSGTFTKLANMAERLGNFAGAGTINFGSLAIAGARKGKELAARKKTLDGIINTKIKTVTAKNPTMSRGSVEKLSRTLAFLEIREQDKSKQKP